MQVDLVDGILSGEPSANEALFRFEYRLRSEQNLTEAHEEIARQILEALSRREREALIRFYLMEQAPEQICREMGLADTQFQAIKARARSQFYELRGRRGGPFSPETQDKPAAASFPTTEPATSTKQRPDMVLAHALETFGSKEKADHWLHRPSHVFHGKTPLEIIESDPEQVEIELTRIDHGVYI